MTFEIYMVFIVLGAQDSSLDDAVMSLNLAVLNKSLVNVVGDDILTESQYF